MHLVSLMLVEVLVLTGFLLRVSLAVILRRLWIIRHEFLLALTLTVDNLRCGQEGLPTVIVCWSLLILEPGYI